MTTIEDIKKQLSEIIELSDKATPGEWVSKRRFRNSFEISEPHIWLGESSSLPMGQQKLNASFVATSRSTTPRMAKVLLGVIERLESEAATVEIAMHGQSPRRTLYAIQADKELETICREWAVQA